MQGRMETTKIVLSECFPSAHSSEVFNTTLRCKIPSQLSPNCRLQRVQCAPAYPYPCPPRSICATQFIAQAARADLKQLREIRVWSAECEEVGCALIKSEKAALKSDARLFSRMVL